MLNMNTSLAQLDGNLKPWKVQIGKDCIDSRLRSSTVQVLICLLRAALIQFRRLYRCDANCLHQHRHTPLSTSSQGRKPIDCTVGVG